MSRHLTPLKVLLIGISLWVPSLPLSFEYRITRIEYFKARLVIFFAPPHQSPPVCPSSLLATPPPLMERSYPPHTDYFPISSFAIMLPFTLSALCFLWLLVKFLLRQSLSSQRKRRSAAFSKRAVHSREKVSGRLSAAKKGSAQGKVATAAAPGRGPSKGTVGLKAAPCGSVKESLASRQLQPQAASLKVTLKKVVKVSSVPKGGESRQGKLHHRRRRRSPGGSPIGRKATALPTLHSNTKYHML